MNGPFLSDLPIRPVPSVGRTESPRAARYLRRRSKMNALVRLFRRVL